MLVSHNADQIKADADAAGAPLPTYPSYDIADDAAAEENGVTYESAAEANAAANAAHPEWDEQLENGLNEYDLDPATEPYLAENLAADGGEAAAEATDEGAAADAADTAEQSAKEEK